MIINTLKEFIDSRGLTVYQFWKQAGITQSAGYRLYHNRDVLPLKRVLDKICTAYQIQPWELLRWEPDNISSL